VPIRAPARWLTGLALAVALALATATPVLAHATLLASDPGNGAVLAKAPGQLLLQFDVPVNARLSRASLYERDGSRVAGTSLEPAEGGSSLVVTLPALPNGAYRLAFQVRDDTDLHETGGAIVFGIGEPVDLAPQPVTAAAPSYLETASRWLELGGICLLVGLVAALLVILPSLGRSPACRAERRRLLAIATLACAAVAVGRAGQLAATVGALVHGRASPASYAVVAGSVLTSDSRFALLWLACVGLVCLSAVAAWEAIARRRSRLAGAGLLAASSGLVLVSAQGAHGSNRAGWDPLQVIAGAVHLGAAGLWIGGLLVLAILFAGSLRGGGPTAAVALVALRRFTGLAFLGVGLLLVSGLVLAGRAVVSPASLLSTAYGLTLLAKLAACAVALAVGLRHTLLLSPRPGAGALWPGRLASSLPFEVAAMLVVLWGAAALGATAPATAGVAARNEAPILRTDTSMSLDDLVVSGSLAPAHPGANSLLVQVRGATTTAGRLVSRVEVTLVQPGQPPLRVAGAAAGAGRYEFPQVHVSRPGSMDVAILVTRGDGTVERMTCVWTITRPPAGPRSPLPMRPWAPALNALATALGLALLVFWAGRLLVRRRRPGTRAPAALSRSERGHAD